MRGGTGSILGLSKDGLSTAHSMLGRMGQDMDEARFKVHSLLKTRKNTNIASQIYKLFG